MKSNLFSIRVVFFYKSVLIHVGIFYRSLFTCANVFQHVRGYRFSGFTRGVWSMCLFMHVGVFCRTLFICVGLFSYAWVSFLGVLSYVWKISIFRVLPRCLEYVSCHACWYVLWVSFFMREFLL